MKKLVRLFVLTALTVTTQAALAADPQPPLPLPPILHPNPGPAGGPVDPTPVQPPVSS